MKFLYSLILLFAVLALTIVLVAPFAMFFFDETPMEQIYGTVFSLALFGLPLLVFSLYLLPSPFAKGKPQNVVS